MSDSPALWRAPAPVAVPPDLAGGLGVPERVAELLVRRGHRTLAAARAFLDAAVPGAPDPGAPGRPGLELPDLDRAVDRVLRAVRAGEPIWVYGDYDADGVSAAALLVRGLQGLGAAPGYCVPDRSSEGYGLNERAVRELAAKGARLLITCGCGITACAEIATAAGLGLDVVVTDHHEPGPVLPERAAALVSPRRLPPDHPAAGLAGAGVAWVLARALLAAAGAAAAGAEAWLELVAVGTLAAAVPVTGANRALLLAGLPRLRAPALAGLRALLQVSRLAAAGEEDVALHLGPRLSAAGRLGDARLTVRLLLSDSDHEARGLARQLDDLNTRCQEQGDRLAAEALALLQQAPAAGFAALYRPGWPEGMLGAAAGQLSAQLGLPVALMARKAGGVTVTGSARAPAGFPLLPALQQAGAGLLTRCGGHQAAAGFSLPEAHAEALLERLRAVPGPAARPAAHRDADLEVPLAAADRALYDGLRALAPFGPGHPAPVLFARGVTVLSSRPTAGARHLRLVLRQGEATAQAVYWHSGGAELPAGPVDVAFRLDLDRWNGAEVLQLAVVAVQPAAGGEGTALPAVAAPAEWLDRRGQPPHVVAAEFPAALLYREGPEGAGPGEVDRYRVGPCQALVFLTQPPSPRVWAEVLALAAPRRVVLAWPAAHVPAPPFPRTLLGLLRYALEHRGGAVSLAELAARTGELEATVMAGLQALAASGFLSAGVRGAGRLAVARRETGPARLAPGPERERLQALLRETAAFRRYLSRAPLDHLRVLPE